MNLNLENESVKDQAEGLRMLRDEVVNAKPARQGVTRVISVTSGKGGVGKSTAVVNIAVALARAGRNVLVLDADLGLANIDVMLGIQPRYTLNDLFENGIPMKDIVVEGPEGIAVIPAASGVESICSLDTERRMVLLQAIEEIAVHYDYLLIDTSAGIGSEVMYFNSASSEIVVVINGEPTSLTDAYALVKVMSQNYDEKRFSVLVNTVSDEREGAKVFNRFAKAVERFLHVELNYLGSVPEDRSVAEAVASQRALVELYPSSQAALAFSQVARRMDSEFLELRVKGGMQFFFKQLLELSAYGS